MLALGAGLCAGLLPGCLRPRVDHVPRGRAGDLATLLPEAPPPASPYDPKPSTGPDDRATAHRTETARPAAPPPLPPAPPAASVEAQEPAPPPEADVVPAGRKEPAPPRKEPLLAALDCYRDGRPDDALEHLRSFDPATRDVLAVLLPLAVHFSAVRLDRVEPRDMSAVLEQFERVSQLLHAHAALAITKCCFCDDIRCLGEYIEMPADRPFQAGAGGRPGDFVKVYVELHNLTCRKQGLFYETALASTLTIKHPATGRKWPVDRPAQVARSLTSRPDWFLTCHFCVPPDLPVGDYDFIIEVKDVTGLPAGAKIPAHRIARRSLPFRVTGGSYAHDADR